ncbi:Uncharacterised protein [Legionella maceachernii]|nr:Uncharacterised protein [Legionella maceachernii]
MQAYPSDNSGDYNAWFDFGIKILIAGLERQLELSQSKK